MTFHWTLSRGRIIRPAPFCIAGILNVTPDSFATGEGALPETAVMVARGLTILSELEHAAFETAPAEPHESNAAMPDRGTQGNGTLPGGMLDMGAESTRPGAPPVSEAEEARRLFPVLEKILEARPDALISVDTTRAAIAAKALEQGACVINDVSACLRDPGLYDVLGQYRPGYVLMHSGGTGGKGGTAGDVPAHGDILEHLLHFFDRHLRRLQDAGLPPEHVTLDPGIGFGKTPEQNWNVLRGLSRLNTETRLGRPLYVGLSMKSLFRTLPGTDSPERRKTATQAAVALCSAHGVRYHRVHHVADTVTTLRVAALMLSCRSHAAAPDGFSSGAAF